MSAVDLSIVIPDKHEEEQVFPSIVLENASCKESQSVFSTIGRFDYIGEIGANVVERVQHPVGDLDVAHPIFPFLYVLALDCMDAFDVMIVWKFFETGPSFQPADAQSEFKGSDHPEIRMPGRHL